MRKGHVKSLFVIGNSDSFSPPLRSLRVIPDMVERSQVVGTVVLAEELLQLQPRSLYFNRFHGFRNEYFTTLCFDEG